MTASESNCTTGENSIDRQPVYADPVLELEEGPFHARVDDDRASGRAEVDVEVWGESRYSEGKVHLHGNGETGTGEYRAGFVLSYTQALRLRELLNDALNEWDFEQ